MRPGQEMFKLGQSLSNVRLLAVAGAEKVASVQGIKKLYRVCSISSDCFPDYCSGAFRALGGHITHASELRLLSGLPIGPTSGRAWEKAGLTHDIRYAMLPFDGHDMDAGNALDLF